MSFPHKFLNSRLSLTPNVTLSFPMRKKETCEDFPHIRNVDDLQVICRIKNHLSVAEVWLNVGSMLHAHIWPHFKMPLKCTKNFQTGSFSNTLLFVTTALSNKSLFWPLSFFYTKQSINSNTFYKTHRWNFLHPILKFYPRNHLVRFKIPLTFLQK